jgi:hypothetical protein
MTAPSDGPPTARTMLPQDSWLCLFVCCRACFHQAPADLQAIIDAGQGYRPVKDLKFRCAKCGSRRTNAVMVSRDVQPTPTPAPGRPATYEGSDPIKASASSEKTADTSFAKGLGASR